MVVEGVSDVGMASASDVDVVGVNESDVVGVNASAIDVDVVGVNASVSDVDVVGVNASVSDVVGVKASDVVRVNGFSIAIAYVADVNAYACGDAGLEDNRDGLCVDGSVNHIYNGAHVVCD